MKNHRWHWVLLFSHEKKNSSSPLSQDRQAHKLCGVEEYLRKNTKYKVPLREVPGGVAQERNNTLMKSCTCLEVVALSTHYYREEHTRILLRTDYPVCGIAVGSLLQ